MRPMAGPVGSGSSARGTLALADISGYTSFLQGVSDAHHALIVEAAEPPAAYALVSSLLDAILSGLVPPFRLVKVEGDAVFVVASDDEWTMRGSEVLDCIRACHVRFGERLAEASETWSCTCRACARIRDLDLKFVVHHGEYVSQHVLGQTELLGTDVNVVHRLLKNHVPDLIGARPYALLSDRALAALRIPADDLLPIVETYEHLPPIPARVLPLA